MRITFNAYKGFIIDGGDCETRIDVRSGLGSLDSESSKKSKPVKEYKTNGFDALEIAWNIGLKSGRIDEGEEIRRLGFNSGVLDASSNDLSSHTTLYGEEVLVGELSDDETDESTAASKSKKKNRGKPSAEERKNQRKKARETKKNAKMAKKQNRLENNHKSVNSKSKIGQLKEILNECTNALRHKHPDATDSTRVLQFDDVPIYTSDLRNLLDDEWLSDNNIGFVYNFINHGYLMPLLKERLQLSKFLQYDSDSKKETFVSPVTLLLPTFTFLIANHPEPLDLVTSKVLPPSIAQSQFIFCPLNDNDDFGCIEGGSHWSLAVFVKLLEPGSKGYVQKVLVFDSMFEANLNETKQLVNNMSQILFNPKDSNSSKHWDIIHVRDSPQQTNGSDCGVFVCSVTSYLLSQLICLLNSDGTFTDFGLKNLRFSAVDSRIWILSTILSFLEKK